MPGSNLIGESQSDFLNLARWIAAGLVVVEHARNLIFVDFGSLESSTPLQKAFYFLTGFGHESVVVFFVISRFLVGGKAWSLWKQDCFDWKRYLADRISRLYAVLLVALLLGGLVDWIGSNYFNDFGFYSNETTEDVAVVSDSFIERLSIHHFFGNLLMLQDIQISTFGSNGPLWSLAHEWWYYLLFPAVLFVIRGSWAMRISSATLLGMLGWFLTPYILILFGVWLIGVVAWWFNSKSMLPWWASIFPFAAAMAVMRLEIYLFPFSQQFLVGITFALLLNSFAQKTKPIPGSKTSRWIADFSYSLYLFHFPVLLLAIAVCFSRWERASRMQFELSSVLLFLAVVALTFAASYLVSLVTEAKTPQIRKLLYGWFGVVAS